jgi:arsenate reductase
LFRENNIDFENVNYFTEELSEEHLRHLLKKANLSPFEAIQKKESIFKQLNITKNTPPEEIIKMIIKNPALLQRPIVEFGDEAVLARPIEKALELIEKNL